MKQLHAQKSMMVLESIGQRRLNGVQGANAKVIIQNDNKRYYNIEPQKRGENKQMMNKIKDIIFYIHLYIIQLLPKLRQLIGKINATRIDTSKSCGVVKIHAWQFKLFKCVTDEDFYIVSGIYEALIKPKICQGYKNFVFSELTYNKMRDILKSNYKWNEQTMFDPPDEHRSIEMSWALGSSPMTLKTLHDWIVIWNEKEWV